MTSLDSQFADIKRAHAERTAEYAKMMANLDGASAAIRKQQIAEVRKLYTLLYATMAIAITVLTIAWYGVYTRSWRIVIAYFAFESLWWVVGFVWSRRFMKRMTDAVK